MRGPAQPPSPLLYRCAVVLTAARGPVLGAYSRLGPLTEDKGEVALTSREGTVKRTAHAKRVQLLDWCMHRIVFVAQPGPTPCAPR